MSHIALKYVFQILTILFINFKLGDSDSDLAVIETSSSQEDRDNNKLLPVKYLLYDRSANSWAYMPQDLNLWNTEGELKVIIHGYNPRVYETGFKAIKSQNIFILGQEYAKHNSSINVVAVDWTPWATRGDYSKAADNTRPVSVSIADKLMIWRKRWLFPDWKNCHLIGAHTAGMVGYRIQQATGAKVGRITGLDPAGPRYDTANGQAPDDLAEFLDKSDAEFVDIIHCNMGKGGEFAAGLQGTLGSVVKAGHVDFYPNGGIRQSHVCTKSQDRVGCSHLFCPLLMAASVRDINGFPACPCVNWTQFRARRCGCNNGDYSNALYMGDAGNGLGREAHRGYYAVVEEKLTQEYFN